MNQGWIKLYRKLLSSDDLFRSAHTFPVFILLLLLANRETGKLTTGRFQLSRWLKIPPGTIYQTLKRLEMQQRINIKSNNKYTEIQICNWHKYQGQYNNEKCEIQQQSNTKQEVRNKNKETTYNEVEMKILKHLKTEETIKSPEGYLNWLIGKYGRECLPRLLKIEFGEWIENLEHWSKK